MRKEIRTITSEHTALFKIAKDDRSTPNLFRYLSRYRRLSNQGKKSFDERSLLTERERKTQTAPERAPLFRSSDLPTTTDPPGLACQLSVIQVVVVVHTYVDVHAEAKEESSCNLALLLCI